MGILVRGSDGGESSLKTFLIDPHAERTRVRAKAVFLDRDGVINVPFIRDGRPYPPKRLEDFRLLPGVADACKLLHDSGYLLIVVTNQPDVGRGDQDQETVEAMHKIMCESLLIDRVEVCYDSGETESPWRKPAPGMILRAAEQLNVDLRRSYMVGDRWRDIDCGHAAGCRTILIDWSYRESLRTPPDFNAPDLMTAAKIIVSGEGGL